MFLCARKATPGGRTFLCLPRRKVRVRLSPVYAEIESKKTARSGVIRYPRSLARLFSTRSQATELEHNPEKLRLPSRRLPHLSLRPHDFESTINLTAEPPHRLFFLQAGTSIPRYPPPPLSPADKCDVDDPRWLPIARLWVRPDFQLHLGQ